MPNSESSDAEDFQLSLQGNRDAFGRLYDRHAVAVRSVVAAVAKDFGAVEDLTQETFTRAFTRLATLTNPEGFRGWLFGIARFVAKERLRELTRKHVPINAIPIDVNENGVHEVDQADELTRIFAHVALLPERDRLAIHAYYFTEQNATEAARIMGISRSSFYAALERGLARLRKELGQVSEKEPNQ